MVRSWLLGSWDLFEEIAVIVLIGLYTLSSCLLLYLGSLVISVTSCLSFAFQTLEHQTVDRVAFAPELRKLVLPKSNVKMMNKKSFFFVGYDVCRKDTYVSMAIEQCLYDFITFVGM